MEDNQESQQAQPSPQPTDQKQINPIIIGGSILVFLLIAGGGFLLTRQQAQPDQIATEVETQVPASQEQSVPGEETEEMIVVEEEEEDSQVTIVEVEGATYYFEPNEIRVNQGDTVRIVFTNRGGTHDFVIDELNVRAPITQTGETQEVEFVAGQTGEFEFYCSVANHRELGVVGTLIVE